MTIGGPLATYTIVILEEDKEKEVPDGGTGEICVAGICLARGYVNLEDRTKQAFIPDFLNVPNNPSGRIYRTGDLGRINDDDEIEFLGRIDTQVKVRGYRIELSEIESVFMEAPEIALAVVDTHEPEPGVVDLAAYYTLKDGFEELDKEAPGHAAALTAAGLHDAGLCGASCRNSNAAESEGRPQEAPAARGAPIRGPELRDR